jgi:transmembrane sensor
MTVNPSIYTSWKDNKLIFLNMDLAELIVLLERKYGVDIQVDEPGILKYHYTGTIKNETILEILDIIKHTLPIEYKIEDQTVHIQKEKLK